MPSAPRRLPIDLVAGCTTRFAPAPTGWLHFGHVVNAIWVWGLARASGGRVLLRIEDHDRERCRPEYEQGLLADLEWLGLAPDAPLVRQSDRSALYAEALGTLTARDLVYVCSCTRREIAAAAEGGDELRYPGTCRALRLPEGAAPMRRIRLAEERISFDDLLLGTQTQTPSAQCGDLLARDRGGNWTYQFAVTVDDIEQGVDLVVRGEDLLASTGRQIHLARMLGRAEPPRYLHHPLILRGDGSKLSKANRDEGVRDLRAAGWSPARVLGAAAHAAGRIAEMRDVEVEELGDLFRGGPMLQGGR